MTTFFNIIFRQQIFTVNFDIIFRLVKKNNLSKDDSIFRQKNTQNYSFFCQNHTNFDKIQQKTTAFFE